MDDIRLSLTEGVTLDADANPVVFHTPVPLYWLGAGLMHSPAGLKAAFHRLEGQGATVAELRQVVSEIDGRPEQSLQLELWLARLSQRGLLARTLVRDGMPLATLQPISPFFEHREDAASPGAAYQLSRFAFTRRDGDEFLLEAAAGHAYLRLHAPAAHAAVHALAVPRDAAGLAAAVPDLSEATAGRLLGFLVQAGAVRPADASEDDAPAARQWTFHDLLFHTRSRLGRNNAPGGGLYAAPESEAPPVVKPAMSDLAIPLARPDLFALKESDLPFTTVLEERGAARRQGSEALTTAQLGEFLYRAARIKRVITDAGLSFRPYTGCAGLYAIEIYPLVSSCQGLDPGLYHYDPLDHRLFRLAEPSEETRRLVRLAGATALLDGVPQVLLLIAARFQRVQARYRSTAYASILQDLGSLYQTMSLVARAMGLASVPLGGGYPDLFARATGLDPLIEASVGEFIVSSPYDAPDAKGLPEEAVVGKDSRGGYGEGVIRKDGVQRGNS
jgi:SagB-type dehydrogenase family enzyme